jgi:hypothetical protein
MGTGELPVIFTSISNMTLTVMLSTITEPHGFATYLSVKDDLST